MRKPIIAGNWKMNKTSKEAISLARGIKMKLTDLKGVEVVLCPPYTALSSVREVLKDSTIRLGAQDVHWEKAGAYTGEISCEMLLDFGCRYVIIGHSERRQYFGETNETVNRKVKAALSAGLIPIICVGERLEMRERGETEKVVEDDIRGAFRGVELKDGKEVVIAYEPVWAIGTGITAEPEQAQEVHQFIRKLLADLYGVEIAEGLRIQYGGSVKPENVRELMEEPDIDGTLVGGASLEVDSFVSIVRNSLRV